MIKNYSPILYINVDEDKSTFVYQIDNKIKYSKQIEVGLKTIDGTVTEFFFKNFGLRIGSQTARTVWKELTNLITQGSQIEMLILGRNVASNELQEVIVKNEQIIKAIASHIEAIIGEAQTISKQIVEKDPTTGMECKILLRGVSEKLKGLAQIISQKTHFPLITL